MGALGRDETTSHTHNITKATHLNLIFTFLFDPLKEKHYCTVKNGQISDLLLKYLLSQGWHLRYLIIFGILNLYPPCDTEYKTETITGWQVLVSQMLRLQSQEHQGHYC